MAESPAALTVESVAAFLNEAVDGGYIESWEWFGDPPTSRSLSVRAVGGTAHYGSVGAMLSLVRRIRAMSRGEL